MRFKKAQVRRVEDYDCLMLIATKFEKLGSKSTEDESVRPLTKPSDLDEEPSVEDSKEPEPN